MGRWKGDLLYHPKCCGKEQAELDDNAVSQQWLLFLGEVLKDSIRDS